MRTISYEIEWNLVISLFAKALDQKMRSIFVLLKNESI
jgi:hypothetical protein